LGYFIYAERGLHLYRGTLKGRKIRIQWRDAMWQVSLALYMQKSILVR